ncbi:hypothetical protein CO180_03520 [candidate division WWE3 bacterium CG_4_9_14_3_um_filter_41_6]|uniref:Uncharacterized protein n=1 Tax=candidate division WWE3 bacterium CG_4_10_14_0_2_um_filter_41_14 TaxID=1975072 RepID=A0A2M7TJN6_UNCKA|nr:MAG: hypothetical protein COY32_02770 [candidate division WWE3 bacterium CG_4_10_14_0_2_um_filter_41_14]PJA38462.1 MAG: hypothetical protein CO180_03520 [candidate division WWE3 bacterium CG_4_9_14_3_um_filter_41_6]
MPWIGKPKIELTLKPKIGDRDDYLANIIGPGETDYLIPISISGTVLAIWGEESKLAAERLLQTIFQVRGTASTPPNKGFWFDSYNSGATIKETESLIFNNGIAAFSKDGADSNFVNQFGKDLFPIKEELDSFFTNTFGHAFFRSFEDAFEDSRAQQDLGTPPKDHANFLYRISILSVFVDHINVRLSLEKKDTPSLNAFEKWLVSKVEDVHAAELVKPLRLIKQLRKQYPLHEEYEIQADGGRVTRKEIKAARDYYGLNDDYAHDWGIVVKDFMDGLNTLMKSLPS